MNKYIEDQMSADIIRQMNDEIEDLRAFKELATELARKGGFKSVNDALVSIIRSDNETT